MLSKLTFAVLKQFKTLSNDLNILDVLMIRCVLQEARISVDKRQQLGGQVDGLQMTNS